jgi:hypothetical protein
MFINSHGYVYMPVYRAYDMIRWYIASPNEISRPVTIQNGQMVVKDDVRLYSERPEALEKLDWYRWSAEIEVKRRTHTHRKCAKIPVPVGQTYPRLASCEEDNQTPDADVLSTRGQYAAFMLALYVPTRSFEYGNSDVAVWEFYLQLRQESSYLQQRAQIHEDFYVIRSESDAERKQARENIFARSDADNDEKEHLSLSLMMMDLIIARSHKYGTSTLTIWRTLQSSQTMACRSHMKQCPKNFKTLRGYRGTCWTHR